MRQCWLAPDRTTQPQVVFVDSAVAPTSSPALAGNPIVPAGYIRQIGSDGYADTRFLSIGGAVKPYITSFVVPYFSGGWPPDPQTGQPGHTSQGAPGEGPHGPGFWGPKYDDTRYDDDVYAGGGGPE